MLFFRCPQPTNFLERIFRSDSESSSAHSVNITQDFGSGIREHSPLIQNPAISLEERSCCQIIEEHKCAVTILFTSLFLFGVLCFFMGVTIIVNDPTKSLAALGIFLGALALFSIGLSSVGLFAIAYTSSNTLSNV